MNLHLDSGRTSSWLSSWQHYSEPKRFAMSKIGWMELETLSTEVAHLRSRIEAARARCLVPGFDGALFSPAWRDALWARFFMAAPRRQRQSVERYSVVKRA